MVTNHIIERENASHYFWGAACEAWVLLNREDLCVKLECMPPDTSETKHLHQRTGQFFFVISGQAKLHLEHHAHTLTTKTGFYVAPGMVHRIANEAGQDLEFLVISGKDANEDRINL